MGVYAFESQRVTITMTRGCLAMLKQSVSYACNSFIYVALHLHVFYDGINTLSLSIEGPRELVYALSKIHLGALCHKIIKG